MKVAYADPPYIGKAKKHYGDHPDFAGEVDYRALVGRLVAEFPDGWALSLSTPTLRDVLNFCHDAGAVDVRVGAWVKPWAVFKPGVGVAHAWEPVVWRGGRKRKRSEDTARDWVLANAVMRRKNDPNETKGSKPEVFCSWLFDLLNLKIGDELVDLFPGSGAVCRYWEAWRRQMRLPLAATPRRRQAARLFAADPP